MFYFPEPYKEEIVYSLIARYSEQTGLTSPSTLNNRLFNAAKHSINLEIPNNIGIVLDKLKQMNSNTLTIENLFANHTLIPLYKPFLDSEKYLNLYSRFVGRSNHPIYSDKALSKKRLYFCRSCALEQLDTYGEAYWTRVCQAPGVYVCPTHKEFLFYSPTIEPTEGYIPMSIEVVRESCQVPGTWESFDELLALAQDIELLLTTDIFPENPSFYFDKYLIHMKCRNMAFEPSNIIKPKSVAQFFKNSFHESTLTILNVGNQVNDTAWVKKLKHAQTNYLHPIKHLLFMQMFAGGAQPFIEETIEFLPYGSGPWICLNPLSNHRFSKVVKDVEIGYSAEHKEHFGIFTCVCGFKYKLNSPIEDPLHINLDSRTVELGEVWYRKLKKMREKNIDFIEIVKKTEMEPYLLDAILNKKRFANKSINEIRQTFNKERFSSKEPLNLTKHYEKILSFIQNNPEAGRREIMFANMPAYQQIKKQNPAWLEGILPPPKTRTVDWKQLDEQLLTQVTRVVDNWEKQLEAGRITRNAISEKINNTRVLTKNHLLPRTNEYIESILEDAPTYYKRKIPFMLSTDFKNKKVVPSYFYRQHITRKHLTPELKEFIIDVCRKHNYDL